MVAGPFTHNSSLCDKALGYVPGSQVVPAAALDWLMGGAHPTALLSFFQKKYVAVL